MMKTIEFETTQFDLDFMNHIKRLREDRKWSQEKLSLKIGVAKSFVSNVESYTQRHKYSTRHIALLAQAFEFDNISKLLNFPTPKYDKIKVIVKVIKEEKDKRSNKTEIVSIKPL